MLNYSILSLRVQESCKNFPFFSKSTMQKSTFFSLRDSKFQKFFSSFIFSSGNNNIRIRNSEFSLFLDSPVTVQKLTLRTVEEIAKECTEFTNLSNIGPLYATRDCTYITDSYWNETQATAFDTTGAVMMERVNFSFCSSPRNGGAINMVSTNDCELTDCIFRSCTAGNHGGAFFLDGKNILLHMNTVENCKSTNMTSVKIRSRSVIVRHFYIDRLSNRFEYVENQVYYPNYYAVISHSIFNTNVILNVTNVTISNTELNAVENTVALLSTATNISLNNVAFRSTLKCFQFDSVVLSIHTSNIFVLSYMDSIFIPPIDGIKLIQEMPYYPERTPVPGGNTDAGNIEGGSTSSGGLATGWIVVIVITCIIVLCAIVGAIYYCITHTSCTFQNDEKIATYNFG